MFILTPDFRLHTVDKMIRENKLSISSCVGLRILQIHFAYSDDQRATREMYDAVCDILLEVPLTIRQIVFGMTRLRLPSDRLEVEIDWSRMASIISRFPKLRRFVFKLGSSERDAFEQIVRENLPELYARGTLEFTVGFRDWALFFPQAH